MHTDNPDTATSPLIREGAQQIALLRADTDEAHIAEHIRGMVAATMGYLGGDASAATLQHAELWQDWALGVADGL